MTKVKKLVAALVAAISMGAIDVTAFAAADPPCPYFFKCSGQGGDDWSGEGKKINNEQTATVDTDMGYVSSVAYILVSIYDENKSEVLTNTETIKSPDDTYTLKYKKLRGAGSYNYLYGRAGYHYAEVTGTWTP